MVDLSGRELGTEIIESCRLGDRDAFRALYDLYKDRVYSIALYFFHGDPAAASDVTQQVFLKLMTSIHQFRGDAEFSTWLYRLVVNACVDAAPEAASRTSRLPIAPVWKQSAGVPGSNTQESPDFARTQNGPTSVRASRVGAAAEVPDRRLTPVFRRSFL